MNSFYSSLSVCQTKLSYDFRTCRMTLHDFKSYEQLPMNIGAAFVSYFWLDSPHPMLLSLSKTKKCCYLK